MSRQTNIVVLVVLACLIMTSAFFCLSAEGRFRLHPFEFGVQRGIEDRQSGITYATDAPGGKMFRNGLWTEDDKVLVLRVIADPPTASRREVSIFIAGYNCGYYSPVFEVFLVVVFVAMVVFVYRGWNRLRRNNALSASSTGEVT